MLDVLVDYTLRSMGLLPLMVLIFIAGVAIIVERLVYFAGSVTAGSSLEYDLERVAPGNLDDAVRLAEHYRTSPQGSLVKAAIAAHGKPEVRFEREIDEAVMFRLPELDRNLWVLDTAVTLGPLLGLLGTIVGMIESFNVLGLAGTSNPAGVTGGIAHALVATAFGLLIAIVCVVFLNYFNKRIRLVVHQMDLIKSMLVSRYAG